MKQQLKTLLQKSVSSQVYEMILAPGTLTATAAFASGYAAGGARRRPRPSGYKQPACTWTHDDLRLVSQNVENAELHA
jgi:hypothetical protein